jgi:RNA polymerase sigma factor (TIGR02999 family)
MSPPPSDVTRLLRLVSSGNQQARDELFRLVQDELRKRAHVYLRQERKDPSLQTTVLIDDVFLKLTADQAIDWQDRAQFYRLAARVMRQLLVDRARERDAQRRGGGVQPAPLDQVAEPLAGRASPPLSLLIVDEALTKLAQTDPELAEMVELHHFGGWELKQIAEDILHIPYKQAKTRWQLAKAWLRRELQP